MSIARVNTVSKAQKDQGSCEKCSAPISKGAGYLWYKLGFRSRHKHVRCLKCGPPSASALESNEGMSMVLAAGEELDVALTAAETKEDVESAVQSAASGVQEALDSWQEKYDNLESSFAGGCPAMDDIQDYLDQTQSLIDALEGFECEDTDEESEDADDPSAPDIESWREQGRSCWDDNNNL